MNENGRISVAPSKKKIVPISTETVPKNIKITAKRIGEMEQFRLR